MNEKEIADLLERATRDLSPDVEALVAGGLRRGQVRQRRRRVAGAAGAILGAVLIVGLGAQVLGTGDQGRAVDPAGPGPASVVPSATPTGTTTPTTPTTPTTSASVELAVTTQEVPTTFASLAPGEVGAPSANSGPDSAPVVDFTWNGLGIRVALTPDDYSDGTSIPDPARRCAEQGVQGGGFGPCRPRPEGTVVQTATWTNPEVDGGTRERSVYVYRPDGWDVLVVAYNGPGKEGPATQQEPPFDLAELQQIALSDVWFR